MHFFRGQIKVALQSDPRRLYTMKQRLFLVLYDLSFNGSILIIALATSIKPSSEMLSTASSDIVYRSSPIDALATSVFLTSAESSTFIKIMSTLAEGQYRSRSIAPLHTGDLCNCFQWFCRGLIQSRHQR